MNALYAKAVYGQPEIDAVTRVLHEQPLALMNGPSVAAFEAAIAATFGKAYGAMTNSGSSANTLAVEALLLEPGSEVITPALTFSTTVAPLVRNGLVPVFVDVEEGTYNIDASAIEEAITPQVRAVMVPNLIGNLPDWKAIRDLCDNYDLIAIEDSCDTLGATIDGRPTGRLSDISTTSFYASHIITAAGFGGMVTTDSREMYEQMLLRRGWGRASTLTAESEQAQDRFEVEVDGIEYDAKFEFAEIGHNFLPSELSAAFGLVQLESLDVFARRRHENFASLRALFGEFEEWFVLPAQHPTVQTAWLAFPLTIRDDAPFTRRDLQIHFETAGIQTRVVFTGNILRQSGFRSIQHRRASERFAEADRVMRGGILIGAHHGMGEPELDHIRSAFRSFVESVE